MTENNKKPSLRFKGFNDTWEQRKLGEIVGITMGQSPDGNTYSLTPTEYILVQGNANMEDGWVKPRLWTTQMTKKANAGDLIMSVRAPAGSMGKTAYNAVIGRGVAAIKGNEFIFQSLSKMNDDGYWKKLSCGSTFESLNSQNIFNAEINLPNKPEQEKIGTLFSQLDTLITLQQRKYDKLQNIKKGLLEKMFPASGSNIPKIRFKGFTDTWEQRKVTELGNIFIGLVTTMTKHYTNNGSLLIRNSDIKDNHFSFGDDPIYLDNEFAMQNSHRMHKVGDVITVHTGDVGTSAVITEKERNSIGFATIVTRPDINIIRPEYLSTFLNTDTHKKWAIGISTGDGRTNYNLGDYVKLIVPKPCIDEQIKISNFISQLDTLITLQQRKLEKLKNIKNACLKKMFI